MNSQHKNRHNYGLDLYVIEFGIEPQSTRRNAEVAKIGRDIIFDPSILDTYHYDGWKPVHYDLMMLCAAVEFADRRCARRSTQWSRTLKITLPVKELSLWKQPSLRAFLRDALCHLTGDDWQFEFVKSNEAASNDARQRTLPFNQNKEFVIAYSDGLDSRCVSGIYDTGDNAIRVRITKTKDCRKKGERPFDQIPFKVKSDKARESSFRSRGFIFAAVTAIAGHLAGISRIKVPESGQGALGPVLLPLHNIYADYRNHPTFFRKMERFTEVLLAHTLTYEQPRLWHTKAQTIATYISHSGNGSELLTSTRSCWQKRHNVNVAGKRTQCGLCAACLLRRMSMHAAGVEEPGDTYTVDNLSAASYEDAISQFAPGQLTKTLVEDGSVGMRHLLQLANMTELPDFAIKRHVFEIAHATGCSTNDTHNNLRVLLDHHSEEWHNFAKAQGPKSFIKNWTIGGRYG